MTLLENEIDYILHTFSILTTWKKKKISLCL